MKTLNELYYNKDLIPDADGGNDKGTVHSYIDFYEQVLNPYRNTHNSVLEIGIYYGHSLRMWREYFPNAKIVGVDREMLTGPIDGCTLIHGNATYPSTFFNLDNFDVIIDDGSHRIIQQLTTFKLLFPRLNLGGIYLIEDVADIDATRESFENLHPSVKIHDFRKNKNRSDDVIVEIRKDVL